MKAFAFDAYGTLFDVFSVASVCEREFPGHGHQLAQVWRTKQLQYTWLRSLMGRYRDFWKITGDALDYSAKSLGLGLTAAKRDSLMDSYLHLMTFPDVKPGLEGLKAAGLSLAVLSNGAPHMLHAAAETAGINALFDAIISVDSVKMFKPSAPVYDLVPARLNVAKAETAFVSSNSWDVQGATSAGFTAIWIRRSASESAEELGHPAAQVVSAVTGLLGLF